MVHRSVQPAGTLDRHRPPRSIVVLSKIAFSYIAKIFNSWYNSFYNTLQEKDFEGLIIYMAYFFALASYCTYI